MSFLNEWHNKKSGHDTNKMIKASIYLAKSVQPGHHNQNRFFVIQKCIDVAQRSLASAVVWLFYAIAWRPCL